MNNNKPGIKANLLPVILVGMGLATLIGVALIIRSNQDIANNPIAMKASSLTTDSKAIAHIKPR